MNKFRVREGFVFRTPQGVLLQAGQLVELDGEFADKYHQLEPVAEPEPEPVVEPE